MNTMVKRSRIRIQEKTFPQVVGQGILSAEITLFEYCQTAKTRLERLSKVIEALEVNLTSDQALEELKNKPMSVQFDYYNAYTKIIMNLVGYMEKIHVLVADQAKFNLIKNKIDELLSKNDEDKDRNTIIEGKAVVTDLLQLMHNEMIKRDRKS